MLLPRKSSKLTKDLRWGEIQISVKNDKDLLVYGVLCSCDVIEWK